MIMSQHQTAAQTHNIKVTNNINPLKMWQSSNILKWQKQNKIANTYYQNDQIKDKIG
jgi:hypothetical protein